MTRSCVWLLVLLIGLLTACTGQPRPRPATDDWKPPTALPTSPPLPSERLAFNSDRTGNFELFTMPVSGGEARQLTSDPTYDSWSPRLSPDRRTILFNRTPAGTHDLDFAKTAIWAVAADGGGATEIRPPGLDGWDIQGHQEWAPDGSSIVMFGGPRLNPQIQLTDSLGQHPRPVTGQRPGTNLDPAFSPDGQRIVFVGCPGAICFTGDYEIYEIPVEGGDARRLTKDGLRDHDPMIAPDGSQLAWLTNISGGMGGVWDVRTRDQDGITRRLVGDSGITSRPEYSADGRWIYLHRIPPGGSRFEIFRVRPDGSALTSLTSTQPGSNEYPSP